MVAEGHLVACHLFQQSKSLWGEESIADLFGRPQPYRDAKADILSFHSVLDSIPAAMHRCAGNSVYEFGLLYVCVRNIAMSASWHLRSEEHTSELQSLLRISYAVFCLKKKNIQTLLTIS